MVKILGGYKFRVTADTIGKIVREIDPSFAYILPLERGSFWKRFFPKTVKSFLGNSDNGDYRLPPIDLTRKLKDLDNYERRLVSLNKTLQTTTNILIDLSGIGPEGGVKIYEQLKAIAKDGGKVILVDLCDEFAGDCSQFIDCPYLG